MSAPGALFFAVFAAMIAVVPQTGIITISVLTYSLPAQRHCIGTRRYVLDGETRYPSSNRVGLAPPIFPADEVGELLIFG